MYRTIKPELLDSLPPEHPDAARNRRDLRVINALMGNHRWFARTLPRRLRPRDRILELGAGTGELGVRLDPLLPRHVLAGIDLWPRPADWPERWPWWQTDLLDFQHFASHPVVMGNLIFHQFRDDELRALGAVLDRTARLIVASEPARRRLHVWQVHLVARLFGLNHVSRHDARVSIEAGFVGEELPRALGLSPRRWSWRCRSGLRGFSRLVAVRRA
jgi:hypothetical protein